MPSLYVEIEIEAPRQAVWQVLVQKQYWIRWNTFLYERDPIQRFEQGRPVSLSLKRVFGEEETEFQPTVTLIQPGVCLTWICTAPGFKNEHIFQLQEIGVGRTKYIHQENFSGPLTRLFLPFIRQDEHQGMKRMAYELKRYTEQPLKGAGRSQRSIF